MPGRRQAPRGQGARAEVAMSGDDDWFERVVLDPTGPAEDASHPVDSGRETARRRPDEEDDLMDLVASDAGDPSGEAPGRQAPPAEESPGHSQVEVPLDGSVDPPAAGEAWTDPDGAPPSISASSGERPAGVAIEAPSDATGPNSTDSDSTSGDAVGPPTVRTLPSDDPPTQEIPVIRIPPAADDSAGEGPGEGPGGGDAWSDYGEIVDTSEVSVEEMTGIWVTTDLVRESPLRMDGEPIDPEELDLPPEVCDRLRDWSDQWHAEWDPDRGWLPRARIGDFEALGHWLARRVKDGVGALEVTLHLPHLGRSGIETIEEPGRRRPMIVTLGHTIRGSLPVRGDFVTEFGVGSFSSEINGRLEAWADDVRAHRDNRGGWRDPQDAEEFAEMAEDLADDMEEELGPDYLVELELWPE